MAKAKHGTPVLDDDLEDEVPETVLAPAREIQTTIINTPIVELRPNAYCRQHVEIHLTGAQAETLRRIHDALEERGDMLDNGRAVRSPADALRWIIEQA